MLRSLSVLENRRTELLRALAKLNDMRPGSIVRPPLLKTDIARRR